MDRKLLIMIRALAALALAMCLLAGVAAAEDQLPAKVDQSCLKCHSEYGQASNLLAGKFVGVSTKAKSIQLKIDKDMEVIFFDDATVLKNAEGYKAIPKDESVRIVYYKKDGKNFAKEVEVKKGIAVPEEKMAGVEEVAALVEKRPEKGKYVLVDSRPKDLFDQGHIPTAVSMPFFAFDKLAENVLPKDKDVLQIYYCGGFS